MTAPLPLGDLQAPVGKAQPHILLSNDIELYALTGLLLFAPLAFGAVEWWAIFILQFTASGLMSWWLLRQIRSGRINVRWNPIFAPMAAFATLNAIQLIPGLSGYRYATRSALLLNVAFGLVCFLLTQVLDRTTHLRRLGVIFTVYGSTVALFAVLQGLSSTTKLYWVRTPRFGGWIYGPYVNHNHYAGLMEMLAPVPLVFAFSHYAYGRKKWLAAGAAAFMGASIFLSGSRGGMTAFTVEVAIFCFFVFRERTRSRVLLLLGVFFLIGMVSIAYIGGSEVTERISTMTDYRRSDLSGDLRVKIDRDSLAMFRNRPVAGWGLGTFTDVFPQFQTFYTGAFINAAHNDYLQLLTEGGVVGFAIAIWFLITAMRRAVRKTRNWPSDVNGILALAALLGICGILVHSAVDFNLQVPANAMLFYVLCTAAALDPRFRNLRREYRTRNTETMAAPEEAAEV